MLCSCFLPVALYFILKYAAHAKPSLAKGLPSLQLSSIASASPPSLTLLPKPVIGVSAAIFGLISLPSLILRTLSLTNTSSTTSPLGSSRGWKMDYSNWNFIFGFMYITLLIVISTVHKPANPRLASLPRSLLMLQVCIQLLLATILVPLCAKYPFRFSSMAPGEVMRPALHTIIEDVVSVDGDQGTAFSDVWNQRYLASGPVRRLLREMDLLWVEA